MTFQRTLLKSWIENGTRTSRVPVVSKEGKPLMPTKASRARKWIKSGKAIKRWSKTGLFYVQLQVEPSDTKLQEMVLALDPGSRFDGITISTQREVQLQSMLILPKGIAKKLEDRKRLRRARRYRKCRRRPCRFNNRKRVEGWIAPSQKAKVDFRLKIINLLKEIYPITTYLVEDVRFNHYKKRWGKHFSTVEIGKTLLYNTLASYGSLVKYSGVDTSNFRRLYRIKKTSNKKSITRESHANDALALCCGYYGVKPSNYSLFLALKRYRTGCHASPQAHHGAYGTIHRRCNIDCRALSEWCRRHHTIPRGGMGHILQPIRRSLHLQNPSKGGIRERRGGTDSGYGFKKGDIVEGTYKGQKVIGWACSFGKRKEVGIATFEKSRLAILDSKVCNRICYNPIMFNIL
ncbi:MAG: RRXRR domain-containing protein [Methanosarcinales archaeon]